MIAGMAHSTVKSGTATRNGVAYGYQLKIRVAGRAAEDRSPVLL
jgi:ribosomal protein L37AE/L43A